MYREGQKGSIAPWWLLVAQTINQLNKLFVFTDVLPSEVERVIWP